MNLILLERNKVGGFARLANYDSLHQFQMELMVRDSFCFNPTSSFQGWPSQEGFNFHAQLAVLLAFFSMNFVPEMNCTLCQHSCICSAD
ncbi:hypothetical protein Scep_007044 [Stephania cephalantha]|uniref:Uncharacterized protein n=1 Tax=Stephania cephalantha TaxID=152367 RepID=A0AAP0K9B2_9MAGN